MTAVAVEYRPAMDSCMVGMRLNRTCALTAPDSSDPGEYPEEYGCHWVVGVGIFSTVMRGPKASQVQVSMKELYNFGVANVLVL